MWRRAGIAALTMLVGAVAVFGAGPAVSSPGDSS